MMVTGINTVRIGGEVKHITNFDAPTLMTNAEFSCGRDREKQALHYSLRPAVLVIFSLGGRK